MKKSLEFTGKTEEEAIARALRELGLSREEISVEVLQLARTGFLGIGSTPAKIQVTYEVPDEPKPEPKWEPEPEPKVESEPEPEVELKLEPEPKPESKLEPEPEPELEEVPDRKGEEEDRSKRIEEFLSGLMERMDIRARVEVKRDEEGNYWVELIGEDVVPLIGRRGETLDAIQNLTNHVVNRRQSHRVRVRIDADGYRAKRERSLIRMANRAASKVLHSHHNFTLEPMNAYERHVIHTALQDRPDVTTYSVGVEPNRRTVIAYSPGEHRG